MPTIPTMLVETRDGSGSAGATRSRRAAVVMVTMWEEEEGRAVAGRAAVIGRRLAEKKEGVRFSGGFSGFG